MATGLATAASPAPFDEEPDGVALALSGGGYRAMMFHVGGLWRLNEIGLLGKLRRISSVSGGSITAGALALAWKDMGFTGGRATRFDLFVAQMRNMAETSVDAGAVIGGMLLPGDISSRVAKAYDRVLFHEATLQDLPDDSGGHAPRFVINATNVQTAALWRFSRPYMADYRVGMVRNPTVSLATAVAASSAFPPVLSPATMTIDQPVEPLPGADLHRPPFTTAAVLSDGGVYDNLGLETVKQYPVVLVSDGGQKIQPDPDPHHDWGRHALHILEIIDNQVRSLRKRHLMEAFGRGDLHGCYWGIGSDVGRYPGVADPLGTTGRDPAALAAMPTRLARLSVAEQDALINWGYAICDLSLRGHVAADLAATLGIDLTPPTAFPVGSGY